MYRLTDGIKSSKDNQYCQHHDPAPATQALPTHCVLLKYIVCILLLNVRRLIHVDVPSL